MIGFQFETRSEGQLNELEFFRMSYKNLLTFL